MSPDIGRQDLVRLPRGPKAEFRLTSRGQLYLRIRQARRTSHRRMCCCSVAAEYLQEPGRVRSAQVWLMQRVPSTKTDSSRSQPTSSAQAM